MRTRYHQIVLQKDTDLVISCIQKLISIKLLISIFFERQLVKKYPLIDLLKFDYRKVRLDEKFEIYYDNGPCEIYMKNVAANIIQGHHLKRKVYLQIISIGLSDLIWKVLATIMNVANKKNKTLNFLANPILVSINCNLKLLLNKINYFDHIIIWFNCVDKIVYRGKSCYFVDAYFCKSKIMLLA